MSPDFCEQARNEFERGDWSDNAAEVAGRYGAPPPPSNRALVWVTVAIVATALALVLGLSLPCDHEFWGGVKVGLGAVCP